MPAFGGASGIYIDQQMFGAVVGCVRTAIAAAATAQTSINIGSSATGGVSGNADTTPPNNAILLIGHPGSGATQNQLSIVMAVKITSSTATVITIPSQSFGLGLSVGDFIYYLGTQAQPNFQNTVYVAFSTATWTSTITDATLEAGEPTSAGNYGANGPLSFLNNSTTIWATAALSAGIVTVQNSLAQTAATSNAAWSTGTTPLASIFYRDTSTIAGGNVTFSSALTPATDIVNGTGVTFSFGVNAMQNKIQ